MDPLYGLTKLIFILNNLSAIKNVFIPTALDVII